VTKFHTDDDLKAMRAKGARVPYPKPNPIQKDPSVKALEGVGQALADHLKVQEQQATVFREEIRTVLEVIKASDGRPITVEFAGEGSPKGWEEIDVTVIRNNNDLISKLKMKKVK